MDKKRKFSVLLGAGSSIPARLPTTQFLSNHVLSGKGVYRCSNGTYLAEKVGFEGVKTDLVKCLVRRVCAEVAQYHDAHSIGREANYEDIYHLIYQMLAEKRGEIENPAVLPFATMLESDLTRLARTLPSMCYKEFLEESLHYIADVVWRDLSVDGKSTGHLKIFEEAIEMGCIDSISTLCHDTHVETHLCSLGINLADGFIEDEDGIKYWKNEFPNDALPFIKLHGSVNWFRLSPDESADRYDEEFGIPRYLDNCRAMGLNGRYLEAIDCRPILLIGTFNKIPDYTRGMFRDLHYKFRQSIQSTDRMIVCGYSFGDKGINSEIIEWCYGERGRRLIIIHPCRKKLVENARRAISSKLQVWEDNNVARIIPKKLECVKKEDIVECMK